MYNTYEYIMYNEIMKLFSQKLCTDDKFDNINIISMMVLTSLLAGYMVIIHYRELYIDNG